MGKSSYRKKVNSAATFLRITKITQDAMDYGPLTMDFLLYLRKKLFTEN
jgi:hypothetical protein